LFGLAHFLEPLEVLLPLFDKALAAEANAGCLVAGLVAFALIAVFGFADGFLLGCDARVIGGDEAHDFLRCDCGRGGLDDLHGDLKTVEEEPCAAGVDGVGGELGENLGERELDGAAVFDGRDDEVARPGVGRGGRGGLAQVGVEVAERLLAQGGRVAAGSAGHDVTTFFEHGWVSPRVPCGQIPGSKGDRPGAARQIPEGAGVARRFLK